MKNKKRIKTNIVELSRFKKTPSDYWLGKFQDGKLDVHEAFKEYEDYQWLYEDSDYDLVGWEIENNCFDWENNSWVIPVFCPEHFDVEKYNWKDFSPDVAKYAPELLDPQKYNWEGYSNFVELYCSEKLILRP